MIFWNTFHPDPHSFNSYPIIPHNTIQQFILFAKKISDITLEETYICTSGFAKLSGDWVWRRWRDCTTLCIMSEFFSAPLSSNSLHRGRLFMMAAMCRHVLPALFGVFTASGSFFHFNRYFTTSVITNSLVQNFVLKLISGVVVILIFY